jgi:hypothetical protein
VVKVPPNEKAPVAAGASGIAGMCTTRVRLRVSLAEYEEHRERTAREEAGPGTDWRYAAWAEALVPVLREVAYRSAVQVAEVSEAVVQT